MRNKSYQKKGTGMSHLPYKLTVFLSCLFALGCTSENEALTTTDGTDGGEIQLGASVNLETRATGQGFELNDRIGLYLAKWTDATTPGMLSNTGNYADNALFELNTLPDSWTTTPKRYYPADGGALDFYAYYPYRTPAFATGMTLNLTVASDQSAYADYTRSDFMVAKTEGVKRSTSKVHLDFYHRLSQMVFVLKPGVGFTVSDLMGAKVKVVNAVVDGTFDLSQGASGRPTEGSTRQDVTPYGTWTVGDSSLTGMMAIVMPQYIDARTYVEVTVGSRKFAFKPTTPIEMRPGCSKEFTITVSNTGIDIETQIHPWNNCGAESGEAKEEEEKEWIVKMTTVKQSVTCEVNHIGDIVVDWGDGVQAAYKGTNQSTSVLKHDYTDGKKHEIIFYGTQKAIQVLQCSNNQLETLDVTKNQELVTVMCSDNQLKALDFSKNPHLRMLVCSDNQLTVLDVSSNPELKWVTCFGNQLGILDMTKNPVLLDLSCHTNQLTALDVTKNPLLTNLSCSENQLENLDVSNNLQLEYLWCTNNKLTTLNVRKNVLLKDLSCSRNQLIALDVSQNLDLIFLDLSVNKVAFLDVSSNIMLTNLSCASNPIGTLDISKNIHLLELGCNSCDLNVLDVSLNVKLTNLGCSFNQLPSIDVSKNTELQVFVCSGNRLVNLDISMNKKLEFLECYGNLLDSLDISQNVQLTMIGCHDNPFFNDDVKALAFVNLLPDLSGKNPGKIVVTNESVKTAVESMCGVKNWNVVKSLY